MGASQKVGGGLCGTKVVQEGARGDSIERGGCRSPEPQQLGVVQRGWGVEKGKWSPGGPGQQ